MKKLSCTPLNTHVALLLLFWVVVLHPLHAQDYTFSQYQPLAAAFNPAAVALAPHDGRAYLAHRSQWLAAAVPYAATLAGAEVRRDLKYHWLPNLGLGFMLIDDNLGQSALRNNWLMLSGNTFRYFDAARKHKITFGLSTGVRLMRIGANDFVFENQFNTVTQTFERSRASGEVFANNQMLRWQLNSGLSYQWQVNDKFILTTSGAFMNVNRPSEKFSTLPGVAGLKQQHRWVATLEAVYAISSHFLIEPSLFLNRQGSAGEWLYGSWFNLNGRDAERLKLQLIPGVFFRDGNAVIPGLKVRYISWEAAVTYDAVYGNINKVNTQPLIGGGLGTLEFSIQYLLLNRLKIKSYPKPCSTI